MTNDHRILLVDDDRAVLDGLCRQHRKEFTLVAACGPEAGLQAISGGGPFAAVVSDYQMPGMNGAEFLSKVRDLAPNTIRIMLTGQADLATATEAVNLGNIFRFLTKPCDPELFRTVLEAGLEQYRLVNAERLLLEQTVRGSIEVLAEVLALSNPNAFGLATRIRHYVKHVASVLRLPNAWQYETAALLSQIGCVALPDDLLQRVGRGESLSDDQLAMMDRHPQLARDLLRRIPRLQAVAEMVFHQQADHPPDPSAAEEVRLGSRILAAALDYEELVSLGAKPDQAMAALRRDSRKYHRKVLDALESVRPHQVDSRVALLPVRELAAGMVLEEEVRNKEGLLVLPRGHELTRSSLQRLRNYGELGLLAKSALRARRAREGANGEEASAA